MRLCDGASNGGTQAINGIIELGRRIARGFRNVEHYRLRMLLIPRGLDASKFALSMGVPWDADEATLAAVPAPSLDVTKVTEPIDRAVLAALAGVVDTATAAFDRYEHARGQIGRASC
ncbi:MAG: Valine-tRNA ligase, partial [Actinomyces urogenitalis DORA_12]